jgi:hypothetical protein
MYDDAVFYSSLPSSLLLFHDVSTTLHTEGNNVTLLVICIRRRALPMRCSTYIALRRLLPYHHLLPLPLYSLSNSLLRYIGTIPY